jgi:basic membrane protein A
VASCAGGHRGRRSQPLAVQAQPAVIYELGGKFDRSFNQAAYQGAELWKQQTGKPYLEFEVQNAAQREQAARRFASRGANPIVGIGFPQASAIEAVARDFPQLRFAIIDMVVALPNVQSFVYREHEGSFLVGMMAALASKTGKVGFVGGMDIPLVRKFLWLRAGRPYALPKVEVISSMTGSTPAAWTDPARGAELTKAQIAQGVDVVFAAAGTTGLGIMQAAKDAGKLSIGVDSNQNQPAPGQRADQHGQACGPGGAAGLQGRAAGHHRAGPEGRRRRLAMDEHNAQAGATRHEACGRRGQGRHRGRAAEGDRLHGGQRLPVKRLGGRARRHIAPARRKVCSTGRRSTSRRPHQPAISASSAPASAPASGTQGEGAQANSNT